MTGMFWHERGAKKLGQKYPFYVWSVEDPPAIRIPIGDNKMPFNNKKCASIQLLATAHGHGTFLALSSWLKGSNYLRCKNSECPLVFLYYQIRTIMHCCCTKIFHQFFVFPYDKSYTIDAFEFSKLCLAQISPNKLYKKLPLGTYTRIRRYCVMKQNLVTLSL